MSLPLATLDDADAPDSVPGVAKSDLAQHRLMLQRLLLAGAKPHGDEAPFVIKMPRTGTGSGFFDVNWDTIVPLADWNLYKANSPPTLEELGWIEEHLMNSDLGYHKGMGRPLIKFDDIDVDMFLSTGSQAAAAGLSSAAGSENAHPLLDLSNKDLSRRQRLFMSMSAHRSCELEPIDTTTGDGIEKTVSRKRGQIVGDGSAKAGMYSSACADAGSNGSIRGAINPDVDCFFTNLTVHSEKDLLCKQAIARALHVSAGSAGWGSGGMQLFFDCWSKDALRDSIQRTVSLVYPGPVIPLFDRDGYVYAPHKLTEEHFAKPEWWEGLPRATFRSTNSNDSTRYDQFHPDTCPQPVLQVEIEPDSVNADAPELLNTSKAQGFHFRMRLYPMPPALLAALLAAIRRHELEDEFPMLMKLEGIRDVTGGLMPVEALRTRWVKDKIREHGVQAFVGTTSSEIKAIERSPSTREEVEAFRRFLTSLQSSPGIFAPSWVRRRSWWMPLGIPYDTETGEALTSAQLAPGSSTGPAWLTDALREACRFGNEDEEGREVAGGEEQMRWTYELVPLLPGRPEELNGRTVPQWLGHGGKSDLARFLVWATDNWVRRAQGTSARITPFPQSLERLQRLLELRTGELTSARDTIAGKTRELNRRETEVTSLRQDLATLQADKTRLLDDVRQLNDNRVLVVANGGNAKVVLKGEMATLDVYSQGGMMQCSTDGEDRGYPLPVAKRPRTSAVHRAMNHDDDTAPADTSVLRVAFLPDPAPRDATLREHMPA